MTGSTEAGDVLVESDVPRFLEGFRGVHGELMQICENLLMKRRFLSDCELVHQMLIEINDASETEIRSLHRFSLAIAGNFQRVHEIDISAMVAFGACAPEVAINIMVNIDEPMEGIRLGLSTLWELRNSAEDPLDSIRVLESGLRDFPDLLNLLSSFLEFSK